MITLQKLHHSTILRNFVFLQFFFLFSSSTKIRANNIEYYQTKKENYAIYLEGFSPIYPSKKEVSSIIDTLNPIDQGIYSLGYAKNLILHKEYSKALIFAQKAQKLFSQKTCKEGIGEAYFLIGFSYMKLNLSDSIVSNFLKAVEYSSLCKNQKVTGLSYNNLGNYFSRNNNYVLAQKYYLKGLESIENTKLTNIQNLIQFNLANNYLLNEKYDEALLYYNKLKKALPNTENSLQAEKLFNNLGIICLQKENIKDAIMYFEKSIKIKQTYSDTLGLINSYENLISIAIQTNNTDYATRNYQKLKLLINEESDLKTKVDFLYNSIEYHLLKNNIKEAHKNLEDYTILNDSLLNMSFSDKLIKMQESFQMQEKEREIALLTKEDELNKAKLKNQQLVIIFIAIFAILLILAGIQINLHRVKLKMAQKESLQINKELEQSNAAKNQILSIIGHDLRGPIGGLKQLMELYLDNPELIKNDIESILLATKESSTNAYHLLENLLTWANSQHGHIKYIPDQCLIHPLIKHTLRGLDTTMKNKGIDCVLNMDEQLTICADIDMLTIIIRNLISNAIKFSRRGDIISINVHKENNDAIFSIKDNGKGMSDEELKQLFEEKEIYYLSNQKTAKGSGLGILLCKDFVEKHQGHIWAESQINVGTTIFFKVPLNPVEILELA